MLLLKDVARPRLSQNCLSRQVCRAGQVSLMERDLPGTASTNRDRISMEMVGQLDVVRQTTPATEQGPVTQHNHGHHYGHHQWFANLETFLL